MTNHGVILGRKKSDWVAGTIPYEIRNPSGDWTPYLVRTEKQWFPTLDTQACVSFSANNVSEIQVKQQTGVEVNFSDRFLAKMSGTTHQGNWLYIVGDTLRKIGGVLEEEWPVPPEPFGWDDYYSPIPQFILDRAKPQFLDKYTIQTEFIGISITEIEKHLKHAPLQIVIPGHAVAGIVIKIAGGVITYFDTYEPYLKTTTVNQLSDVYKILLTIKNMSNATFVHKTGTGEYGFYLPALTPDALKDKALNLGKEEIIKLDGTIDFTKAKEVTF